MTDLDWRALAGLVIGVAGLWLAHAEWRDQLETPAMTKPLADMTPAERARYDEYQTSRRRTDRPALNFHTCDDRMAMAYMGHMHLWTKTAIGKAFDTDRETVRRAMVTYPKVER